MSDISNDNFNSSEDFDLFKEVIQGIAKIFSIYRFIWTLMHESTKYPTQSLPSNFS